MAMAIRHLEHVIPDDTHERYDVRFFEDTIRTLVTHTPSCVDSWISISHIERKHRRRPRSLVVGLDVEWRPNLVGENENPVATLQLCVEHRCLIFQILFAPTMPQSLRNFLRNPSYTFTGVGISNDVEKLKENWNLEVANTADVGALAAEKYGMQNLKNAGLKGLTRRVLGKELIKPKAVTMSMWDGESLTPDQVQYACIDAFLSYKIGTTLISK